MLKTVKYDYGYYLDEDTYCIECLNNDNLYGESLTKKDIVKNTVDFTTGVLGCNIDNNIPIPAANRPKIKRNYDGLFSLTFNLSTLKIIPDELIKA
ncbi:MAG: hypothetical protein JXR68_12065 [Bacteroidales bacterium]|nr:hypothetical protein [Bacteroidales bacterium]